MLKVDGTLKPQFNTYKSQTSTLNDDSNKKTKRQSFLNRTFSIKSSPLPSLSVANLDNSFQAMPSAIMKEFIDNFIWEKTSCMDEFEDILLEKFNHQLKEANSKQSVSSKESKLLGKSLFLLAPSLLLILFFLYIYTNMFF